jgi:hypothetical protein
MCFNSVVKFLHIVGSDDDNDSPFEPRLAFYPGGIEIEDSDMSSLSSSSAIAFMEEDELEDDSSDDDSSDLDDLEDRRKDL